MKIELTPGKALLLTAINVQTKELETVIISGDYQIEAYALDDYAEKGISICKYSCDELLNGMEQYLASIRSRNDYLKKETQALRLEMEQLKDALEKTGN